MPTGRKPTPTVMKKLAGNPGKRVLNSNEPDATAGLPECPAHITGEARLEWDRVGQQMVTEHRMAVIYRAAFAAYCVAWGRWVEAETQVRESGMLITSPNGHLIQSPYLPIANKAWSQMMKAVAELGISPTSQARVSKVGESQAFDPFDEFDAVQ